MPPATLAALKASIAKWQEHAKAKFAPRLGRYVCPLCQIYWNRETCDRCPVAERTGKKHCIDTPYQEAFLLANEWRLDPNSRDLESDFHIAAQAEVDFLTSLLPREP